MILQKGGGFVLNVRCRKILADLLNAPYPIPTEILMEKYDVSERSIKYDIGKLRAYLAENAPDVTLAYQARRGFGFHHVGQAGLELPNCMHFNKRWMWNFKNRRPSQVNASAI